jgi:6-phosphogluconolactonase (cycloisomerase 2 family)
MRRRLLVGCFVAALVALGAGASGAAAAPAYVPAAGSPFSGGYYLWGAAFSPDGAFFATTEYYNNRVEMFKVTPSGGLSSAVGFADTVAQPNAVAFGKQGSTTYLGVATNDSVLLFSVSSSGALSQVGTTQNVSQGPTSLAFNSTGTLLAVGTYSGVQMFGVGSTGLSPIGVTNGQNNDTSVAFSPNGHFLTLAFEYPDGIQVFSVGSGGSLATVGFPVSAGQHPDSVAYSPNGGLLASANQGSDSVSLFSVNSSTGALTAAGSGGSTGSGPSSVAFSPSGKLLATSNATGDSVSLFTVGSGAALAPVSGSPLATGANTEPNAVAFNSTGLLAAPHFSSGISVFAPAAPTVQISAPALTQRTVARGASVATRFTCAESIFGPGLASCTDSNGAHSPIGHLSTATVGAHTYSVFGRSFDGQTGVGRFNYYVLNPPSVRISAPRPGRTYKLRARVTTKFSCHDGAGAPGVLTCADSNGASSGRGKLSTGHYGLWKYVVTTVSKDTLITRRTITFRVAAGPSVSVASPVAGGHFGRGSHVRARYSCHDGLGGPGIKSCHGSVRKGKRINTSRPGRHRFVVVARSKDGRRTRVVVRYFVR